MIALAGEAAVGRTLSKMSALLLGKFYFTIPLIGIYIGLAVMIHRKWPTKWSQKKSGLLLAVLALVLMSTILTMKQKMMPGVSLTASQLFGQINGDIRSALFHPGNENIGFSMVNLNISGGYIGGIEFTLMYSLFGMAGATLIMIVMLAISFMLITGLSYVEMFRVARTHVGQWSKLINKKFHMLRPVPVRQSKRQKVGTPISEPLQENEGKVETDIDNQEVFGNSSSQGIKKMLVQLLGFKNKKEIPVAEEDVVQQDALSFTNQEDQRSGPVMINWNDLDYDQEGWHSSEQDSIELTSEDKLLTSQETGPIIRDFFDHIQKEENFEFEEELTDPNNLDIASTENVPVHVDLQREAEMKGVDVTQLAESTDGASDSDPSLALNSELGSDLNQIEPTPPKPAPKPYKLPSFRLLSKPSGGGKSKDQADYMQTARKLEATLESFGVRARVLEVVRGPAVTRYEIQPDIGVKVSRIVNLTDDIALALAAKDIRMEAPIPGKSAIGIEVPNNEVSLVTMREVMETQTFQEAESKLSIAFGRDISGATIVGNLAKMPHLLVAGATGSGKSVCINGIITSILYKAKPDEVKFLMVDPKMVELNVYNGIPHLLAPVVTDPRRASLALKKIVVEMEKRYELFSKSGARNVEAYNLMMKDIPENVLPYIVVIVDELADLMMVAANDVEDAIARLAQMARAAGIHLIIATQRPSVDVITGVIKANIPSRIAFGVSSQVDSRTILDMAGAEKLLGRGDMLFMPMGASKPVRVQGAFMSDQEVEAIVGYVSGQGQAEYDDSLVPEVEEEDQSHEEVLDELFDQAVQIVVEAKQASVSLLQRRMRVGYTRAARLIDSMEARGIIGPYEGSKPREVLMSIEQYKMGKISS